MDWTEEELAELPIQGGFRQRGVDMTRLETYTDAAFAFAMSVLVISGTEVPRTYDELILAMKGVPAFAASFSQIMLFWVGHRTWSRRFGLEDGVTTTVTLLLIFVMLVYVYPLKLMFSAFLAWVSGGFLPSQFEVRSASQMVGLFVVYGFGAAAMAGSLALLNRRAQNAASALRLSELELLLTRQHTVFWSVQSSVGFLSAAFALVMPVRVGVYAGFIYFVLPVVMPLIAIRFGKKAERLRQS